MTLGNEALEEVKPTFLVFSEVSYSQTSLSFSV